MTISDRIRKAAQADRDALTDATDPTGLQRSALGSVAREPWNGSMVLLVARNRGSVNLRALIAELDAQSMAR